MIKWNEYVGSRLGLNKTETTGRNYQLAAEAFYSHEWLKLDHTPFETYREDTEVV